MKKLILLLSSILLLTPFFASAEEVTYRLYPLPESSGLVLNSVPGATNLNWESVRSATTTINNVRTRITTGDNFAYTGPFALVGGFPLYAGAVSNVTAIGRSYLTFDTRTLPQNSQIYSATLHLYEYNYVHEGASEDHNYMALISPTENNSNTFGRDDYGQCGDLDNPVQIANKMTPLDGWGWPPYEYKQMIFNSEGLKSVNRGGFTKLCLRTGTDIDNVPSNSSWEYFMWYPVPSQFPPPYLEVKVLINSQISTPSDLLAIPLSSSSVALSWVDNSTNESGFSVERSVDGVNFTESSTTSTGVVNLVDTNLSPATTYYYRVRAFNMSGNSDYSSTSVATTLVNPPLVPSNLISGVITTSSIGLSWLDNATNEEGYQIERSIDGTDFVQIATTSVDAISFTDIGLTPATNYYYRVRAFNIGGESEYSNTLTVMTLPLPPSTPTDFLAAPLSSSEMSLAWTDVATNEDGYVIERSLDNVTYSAIATTSADTVDYTDVGLVPTTTYYYRLFAFNVSGVSDVISTSTQTLAVAPSAATALEVNGLVNPIDIRTPKPKFSAIFQDASTTATAMSYEIQVFSGNTMYWDSGKQSLNGNTPVGVRTRDIGSDILFPRNGVTYSWHIKFWDQYDNEGEWSTEEAMFTMKGK